MLFFIFSGLISCAGTPVSASCPIEVIPPTVVVKYGDSFSVNCTSSSKETEGMGWESPIGGTPVREGVSSLLLQIDSLEDWDIEPKCFTNFNDGTQCSKSLPVSVYRMADSVSMFPLSQMDAIVEGKEYHMQCDIANVAPAKNLSVYWRKGNKIVFTESFDKESNLSPVSLSSNLSLTAHRVDNGTQIWCEAKLNLGPSGPNLPVLQSKSHDVIVLYPPTFIKPEKEMLTLKAGGKLSLNCTATGNPMPLYSWHLPRLQQRNKNQKENQPILTVSYPGSYNCTVSNTQGTNTKYFIVTGAETGSHPGTTAGILIAVFFVFIFILGWNHTVLAALIGVFVTLGAVLFILGYFFVTPEGTFSCSNGSYLRGQPTSPGPI